MKIVEGIYRADEASNNIAHSNIYFIVNGEKITVIDTGTQGNAKKIVTELEKLGYHASDVSTIILTHFHMDHVGSAKDLKEATGAQLAASAIDGEIISGVKPYPKPKNLLMRAATSLIKASPVHPDITLKDNHVIAGLKVIATPGHTEGSIMLLDEERKVLVAGDTLRLDGEKVVTGPKQFVWDENKERESIRKVADLDFEVLLPGHGEHLKGNASAAVKALAASFK
ncbi:MAG: MBL fold metallo-hydrolase [Candidatus Bathyarchaeota archaeon]|nr:MBL fold metallo-hydrolase [Candidatus Bathyarchaeota archaeon]